MSRGVMRQGTVPTQALLLSLLSLLVPVLSSAVFPDWTSGNVGVLVWLLALVPGFLLSYYRGWRGASIALAGGMAALSVAQAVMVATDAQAPRPEVLLGVVSVLTAVSLGSGMISTLFHRSLARAERMALTDSGTGMPNRRHALLELERAFAAAERGERLSVVLFDLDHFKRVNDGWGHAEGDRVLASFAAILRADSRAMNVAARFGGEEFVAVLRATEAAGAAVFAERVRRDLRELELRCGTETVSAGVAEYEQGMASPDVLLAAADQALYRAKNTGRDRVVVLGGHGRRSDVPETPPPRDEQDVPMGQGELVLVVDDDLDALRSVARALRRFGYTALEAPSPARAVEIARGLDDPLDLVLTDIVMPEMGGFRLVEILCEIQGDVRVIYMSGYSQEEVDWTGMPGVHGYLSKPISIYTLARTARALLDRPVSMRKRASTGTDVTPPTHAADPGGGAFPVGGAARARPGTPVGSESRVVVVHADAERARRIADVMSRSVGRRAQVLDAPSALVDGLASMRAELIVLDQGLPEDALQDVLDLLGKHEAPPAVLLLGAAGRPDRVHVLAELAPVDVLREPFDEGDLAWRAVNLLRIRSCERWIGTMEEQIRSRVAAHTAELEEARADALLRLARAAEFRDDLTGRHAERVGVLSGLLARELGWSSARKAVLELAAPLHDVGKIAVPDAILRKSTTLTEAEQQVMRSHTVVGAELLGGSRSSVLQAAREVALTHHEHWDGGGYPAGLAGEEIPESGRIVAVADTFDSLTNHRSYRDAVSVGQAVTVLRDNAGAQFDPRVVDAFVRLVESGALDQALDLEVVARPDE